MDESKYNELNNLHGELTNRYPEWTSTNNLGEGLNDKDFKFVINKLETNFVLFKGQLYLYIRYERPDAVVVLHLTGDRKVEEVCYIGRAGSKDKKVKFKNINYHKSIYKN